MTEIPGSEKKIQSRQSRRKPPAETWTTWYTSPADPEDNDPMGVTIEVNGDGTKYRMVFGVADSDAQYSTDKSNVFAKLPRNFRLPGEFVVNLVAYQTLTDRALVKSGTIRHAQQQQRAARRAPVL